MRRMIDLAEGGDTSLRCPLCGSWYTSDRRARIYWEIGEVCDNRAMTGPYPKLCSPEHPCPGLLVQSKCWKPLEGTVGYWNSREPLLEEEQRMRRGEFLTEEDLRNPLTLEDHGHFLAKEDFGVYND